MLVVFVNQPPVSQNQSACLFCCCCLFVWMTQDCVACWCMCVGCVFWFFFDKFQFESLWQIFSDLPQALPFPGLPLWLSWETIHLQCGRPGFDPWVGKISWRRDGLPIPVFWPGEFAKSRSQTEQLSLPFPIILNKLDVHNYVIYRSEDESANGQLLPIISAFWMLIIVWTELCTPNSYSEVLIPSTSECNHTWR